MLPKENQDDLGTTKVERDAGSSTHGIHITQEDSHYYGPDGRGII